jgi:hypothetical protein
VEEVRTYPLVEPPRGTEPSACFHCSGMLASLGREGRRAWHDAGHPGNNGLDVGVQDVPQVFMELRPR